MDSWKPWTEGLFTLDHHPVIPQLVVLVVEQIAQKHLHESGGGIDALVHVGVEGAYDGVAEIPGFLGERVILKTIATGEHVFDAIYKSCTAVGILEGIDHEQLRDEIAIAGQFVLL